MLGTERIVVEVTLPQSGEEVIDGCIGNIRYTRNSDQPFEGWFKNIDLNCQRCGMVSVGLADKGSGILGIVPLRPERMPYATFEFLSKFCGIARGVITRDGNPAKEGVPVEAPQAQL